MTMAPILRSALLGPRIFLLIAGVAACSLVVQAAEKIPADPKSPQVALPSAVEAAAKIDRIILDELAKGSDKTPAPIVDDEEFIRRVSLDLTGELPQTRETTLFCLDASPDKRSALIDRLLEKPEFSRSWAMYWREVIFSRATEPRARLAQDDFENWMETKLAEKTSWDRIAADLITATGDVQEKAETALIFAHAGEPEEIAAEASRIFLGIQIQCANCHDHPTDSWKREQFHEFAAFFPRINVRPKRNEGPRSFEVTSFDPTEGKRRERLEEIFENPEKFLKLMDRNGNQKIDKSDIRDQKNGPVNRLLEQGDKNKDGSLTLAELKEIPRPPVRTGQGAEEHFMSDLEHPELKGKQIDPKFFIGELTIGHGLGDLERRDSIAKFITDPRNPWFARSFVNRAWFELLGQGFYMPVDDMGPERTAQYPEALEVLSQGFIDSGYDVRWVYRTIANTQAYQRALDSNGTSEPQQFAAATPTRIRSDTLFDALTSVLGVMDFPKSKTSKGAAGKYANRTIRGQFNEMFGVDPSTPQDEIVGTVPQTLFLMNNPTVQQLASARSGTRLDAILKDFEKDEDAVKELYLLVLVRDPREQELKTCLEYVKKVDNRREAFEDLHWSLLNSAEFLAKR